MLYAILERSKWTGEQPVSQSPGCVIVDYCQLSSRVDDFTGRGHVLGLPSVRDRLRRTGRVYVAGSRRTSGVVIERLS